MAMAMAMAFVLRVFHIAFNVRPGLDFDLLVFRAAKSDPLLAYSCTFDGGPQEWGFVVRPT